ncbi:hypothetical protein [Paraburkholderia youngii]|uniref:DUF2384 domain-containing protein n=1 Tax=Paraburkholderia youngii TaxID=2782701 RepID=A0A7W8LE56_9BURK|nr:hypothetical protein [Paraburkholderia youngii]MBB5405063.1 hypothetical protein [Paraburkholderia youngii]
MSTATVQASEFSRLLVRAAKMLDRTGARTPEAIRKVVASSMQADIGQLPAKNQQRFAQSIALFAQGFDDALTAVADAAGELTPATKSGTGSSRRVPAQRGRSALHHRAGRDAAMSSVEAEMFTEAMAARAKLAKEGSLLEPAEFMRRAGVTRQAINQRLKTGSLFTVDGPNGVSYYPAFFLDESLDRRTVARVSRALKELPGASKWAFFTNPRRSLGGLTPLEVIGGKQPKRKQGGGSTPLEKVNLSMVLRAAAGYAEE